ncbi:hypothetical protein [Ruegeria sp. Ofav3-42]|uniref:hypothetical protein n=1 Tax=Ruegeria sp. Ofav3-42 TaxID=2917759 RepID=UPI001EF4CAD2|nr:hypothetical protein [Ruegeria sp. Ofav3-42]MCG7518842.1 hypothetical protein [Ruegeria sp. Ofav3-42]
MASTVINALDNWDASARYTANGDTDILLSYPKDSHRSKLARYVTTMSDDLPTIAVENGHPLLPLDSKPMQLKDGERLWMVGPATLVVEE